MFSVELDFRAASYDIDFAGVVSNQVYLRWLEDLRLLFLERTTPIEQLFAQGLAPTLVRTEIDYRAPLRLAERVHGLMWLAKVGNTSFTLEARLTKPDGSLVVEARNVCVVLEIKAGRPVPVPEQMRAAYAAG